MPRQKKQEWTVRVVNWEQDQVFRGSNILSGVWVEQLRYMGLAKELASYDDRNVIEFYCPNLKDYDSKVWAEQSAERMRSFGIDAAAAPKWADDLAAYALQAHGHGGDEGWMEAHMERFNRPRRHE